jgi:tetratricopeptide (TPR) repeat protein
MEWKEKGNIAYQAGNFGEAVSFYTKCLESDPVHVSPPFSAIIWSNRSAAYYALKKYDTALEDAVAAVSIQPRFAKVCAKFYCDFLKTSATCSA